jgi:hypothetical protein
MQPHTSAEASPREAAAWEAAAGPTVLSAAIPKLELEPAAAAAPPAAAAAAAEEHVEHFKGVAALELEAAARAAGAPGTAPARLQGVLAQLRRERKKRRNLRGGGLNTGQPTPTTEKLAARRHASRTRCMLPSRRPASQPASALTPALSAQAPLSPPCSAAAWGDRPPPRQPRPCVPPTWSYIRRFSGSDRTS